MNTEYTYDIDKYTIGVDENGKDGIGMTVAKIENGEINFLGNCYGENARCIDLLIKENQELKKQYCERTDCSGRIGNSKKVEQLQQENKQLKEKVKYQKNKIDNKDNWCQLIADIGFDYDGCNTIESLKGLIDELVRYALNSRDNYDYEEILKGDSNE